MTHIKLKTKNNLPQNAFSLVADFNGDMNELLHTPSDDTLPVLPLRNMMLFPGVVGSVTVGRESSLKVVEQSKKRESLIAVFAQKDSSVEDPDKDDLYDEGVLARVMRTIEVPNGSTVAILQCYGPIKLEKLKRRKPFIRAEVSPLEEVLYDAEDEEFKAMAEACRDAVVRYLDVSEEIRGEEATFAVRNISHPVFLINFICTNMPLVQDERFELLQMHDIKQRAMKLLEMLSRECQLAVLKHNIEVRTRNELDEQQKDFFLRQQMKQIQRELGDDETSDTFDLEEKLARRVMPDKVKAVFTREMEKLQRMNPQMPEYQTQLTYLQTVADLPWGIYTKDNLNVKNAEKVLNHDHYGMERVKERILEHLSTLRFRSQDKAPILCLYGPPGVGKTSLGKSIARALNRNYVRIALGGIHDESEIRGHRRTYIGAMPGRIIKSIMKAESANPLFVLDEIDKMTNGQYNGDPQSALLEVLDPEQNNAFHDNYLDLDFDLSKVFFIATANSLQNIPQPLLDRMELIEVEGYLSEEKLEIARRHLITKKQKEYDLGDMSKLKFSPSAIDFIIDKYTRESGVRQLEKQIDKVFRKVSYLTAMADNEQMPFADKSLKPADIEKLLGKPLFSRDKYQGNQYAGVVTGLAWTAVGGEILFIETSVSRCRGGKLTMTGNLGDVMKESAVLALEYIKTHADSLGLDYRIFDHWGVHVHVPEGATPKDGPSAGITIATSIASALTQRKVRANTAMTGEITLRGKVLPVGGIKEKILAAKRAGITDILISEENRKDVADINERYVKGLTFHFVQDVKDVLSFALLDEKVDNPIVFTIPDEKAEKPAEQPDDVAVRLMKEK